MIKKWFRRIEKWEVKEGVPRRLVFIGAIVIIVLLIVLPPYPFP